ncbi:MAG: hypothetical protein M3N54_10340 [Acidobacteriota bacterium]|nr:hypothetical protein [Acidobacteriota bacterium]
MATSFEQVRERLLWKWRYAIAPDPAAATEYAWQIDPEHTFHLFTCVHYPVCYCIVVGPRAGEVLEELTAELEWIPVSDLLKAFDHFTEGKDRKGLTYALGICSEASVDEEIVSRIRSAFGDAQPEVRLAAVDAAFVTEWDIFLPDIDRIIDSDPDDFVRGTAANAKRDWTVNQHLPNTNR